ncbi:MAG: hypothetical protein JW782_02255 [Candidatus Saganbacteria bacterium]|nr:hypothetical protein [Candidatus Saganbacteria bacterium]
MKRLLFIAIVLSLTLGFFSASGALDPFFTGIYWIYGGISDPDGVGIEGRQVCFFKEISGKSIVGGYADDLAGTVGQSGKAAQYLINPFEDWRLEIAAGTYMVAIPNDNPADPANGYGADPVDVVLTGYGYDAAAKNLVLMKGAGLLPPGEQGAPVLPHFENIRFGNRLYQSALVAKGQEFIVSAQTKVSATAVSSIGLDISRIQMVLNEGSANAKTYTMGTANIVRAAGPSDAPTEVDFAYDFYNEKNTLPEGQTEVTFRAYNANGSSIEVCRVSVAGGEPRLLDIPITYPSPVHLKTDKEVFFQYTLSHDINIDIFVFDVTGRVVKKFSPDAREEGGCAGLNKVSWDLMTDQGSILSSGVFVFTILNRDESKLLGKGKLSAVP